MSRRVLAPLLLAGLVALPASGAVEYRAPFSNAHAGHFYPTAYFDHGGADWNCGGIRYSADHVEANGWTTLFAIQAELIASHGSTPDCIA